MAFYLYQEFLHNHILISDVSHISCHGGHLPGELGNYPHPTKSMMVVRLAPTRWDDCYYLWDSIIIFPYPLRKNITVKTHLSLNFQKKFQH